MSTIDEPTIPTTGSWRIDGTHSTASFFVAHHVVATFRGGFRDIEGSLTDGVLVGSVRTDALELPGPAVFKEHLQAPEWFDGANFSELSFRSTDLRAHGDHLHGAGELTIKGITRPVELGGRVEGPVDVELGGETSRRLGLDLTTDIDRREFNITGTGGAGWIVTLQVALELVEEA
jgi:polyisoprenoid-binding protein YceI